MADIANDVTCATCSHLASAHQDNDQGQNTGPCTMQNCSCTAMKVPAAVTAGAVAPHSTATDDATWDSAAAEKALGDAPTATQLKAAYAWVPDAADDMNKTNCKFIHHEVDGDGTVRAANTTACSTGIGVLNGGRSGTTIPDTDVQGVYNHLRKHLADSGRDDTDIPELEAAVVSTVSTSSSAASGGEAATASTASTVLQAIATAQQAAAAVVDPPVWVSQVVGLLDAAQAAGQGLTSDEAPRWALALDAAVDSCIDQVAQAADDANTEQQAVVTAVQTLDAAVDAYLKAQDIPDPDEEDNGEDDGDQALTADAAAAVPAVDAPSSLQPWNIPVLIVEGVDTGDGRYITAGALEVCDLPQTLMAQTETSDFGHEGAYPIGRIDTCERFDASTLTNPKTGQPYGDGVFAWKADGVFTSVDVAASVVTMIQEKVLKGISADVRDVESVLELVDDDGNVVTEDVNPDNTTEDEFWEALDKGLIRENVTKGRIMGATVLPFPAFEGAYIQIGEVATPIAAAGSARHTLRIHDTYGTRQCAACEEGSSMVAAAAPLEPPSSWFSDPQLAALTPLTVEPDGRVYGHMAAWGTCHTGVSGRCVTPPRSRSDYAYFRTGAVRTDEGELVSVGQLTLGTGHASLQADARGAVDHYDHTGTAVADVAVGEDRFGIWVGGSLRPDATDLQVRQLRAAAISGDWRNIGGRLEMVGALCVNVPGFPVPRVQARVASGAEQSLVAAGSRAVVTAARMALGDLLAWKQDADKELMELKAERLRRAVHR